MGWFSTHRAYSEIYTFRQMSSRLKHVQNTVSKHAAYVKNGLKSSDDVYASGDLT